MGENLGHHRRTDSWVNREDPGDHASDPGGRKTGAGLELHASAEPGHLDVFSARGITNEVVGTVKQRIGRSLGEIDADDRGKVRRPFGFPAVEIAARGHDMGTTEPGFIGPFLVGKDELGESPAAETTIEDVVAPFQSLLHAGADEVGARRALGVDDAEAAHLGERGDFVKNPGDGGAVTIDVVALALEDADAAAFLFEPD